MKSENIFRANSQSKNINYYCEMILECTFGSPLNDFFVCYGGGMWGWRRYDLNLINGLSRNLVPVGYILV